MGCELNIPQRVFLHRQTKGSAEVTEWKGDSGQMLVNPFACYLSSSKNSSSLGEAAQAGAGQAVHTNAWVWNPLPLDTRFKASSFRGSHYPVKFYVRSLNINHEIPGNGRWEGDSLSVAMFWW